jgi:hypothetical protein
MLVHPELWVFFIKEKKWEYSVKDLNFKTNKDKFRAAQLFIPLIYIQKHTHTHVLIMDGMNDENVHNYKITIRVLR